MSASVLDFLPINISNFIEEDKRIEIDDIIEIRLRINQKLQILTRENEIVPKDNSGKNYIVEKKDLERSFLILSKNSYYALERQIAEGFITIPGGHRVGFTGQAVLEKGKIKSLKNINFINYRISHEIIGLANDLFLKIYNQKENRVYNTMLIGPPLCGKTSLLRDLIRIISDGDACIKFKGKKIGLVDERSEIAGAYNAIPQNNIGSRTDLLDNCPKAAGMMLLIRSMSPEVIAVDEIGSKEDVLAVQEAISAGVSLLTTVHGQDLDCIMIRPFVKELFNIKVFERYIILSNRNGIGTIEKILDRNAQEVV
ncbi:stage III sporulation protein AA [Natronospora cellulosivora (SeqCode)]